MFQAGFYEKVITPPLGLGIPGYFDARFATDVVSDLYARAAVVSDGNETVAFLAIDVLTMYDEISDAIAERIHKFTGIKKENILICATHIHTGGPVFEPYETENYTDEKYVSMLTDLSADAVTLAYKRQKPMRAKYACGKMDSISFVRNYKMEGDYVMTNPAPSRPDIIGPCAEIDPELPVLVFCDEADCPRGAVISFACHQDCLVGSKDWYSTDYAGAMDKELKKEYGADFVSVFFQGTCGDINHFDVTKKHPLTKETYQWMGSLLASEIKFAIPDAAVITDETVEAKTETLTLSCRLFSEDELEEARTFLKEHKGEMIAYTEFNPETDFFRYHYAIRALKYMETASETKDVRMQVIRIGDFLMYGFPGEVFVDFGHYIKENAPTEKRMIATLAFLGYSYLPTRELFQPTVYEAQLPTCIFTPDGGHIIADKLIEMGKELIK
ncbi:MAG: neutral/alkaline non-lysosomal ceramidase N-terminal domain-containing protein [Clostridia bacterium]|nr:neutral/alkaline non-lysosomal ceramidase N-terminal domain-containing protein [Clostridia bacterium]